jgi:molecular chaperone DnaK
VPKIEVTFDLDANGILHVKAKDLGTNQEQQIRIQGSSGLSESEIQKMVKDAERFASEDKDRKELIEIKNRAEQQVYHNRKLVKDHGDKLSASDKKDLEDACEALDKARQGDDRREIESAMERLEKAAHRLSEQLYKAAGADAQGAGPAPEGAAGGGGEGGSPHGSGPT